VKPGATLPPKPRRIPGPRVMLDIRTSVRMIRSTNTLGLKRVMTRIRGHREPRRVMPQAVRLSRSAEAIREDTDQTGQCVMHNPSMPSMDPKRAAGRGQSQGGRAMTRSRSTMCTACHGFGFYPERTDWFDQAFARCATCGGSGRIYGEQPPASLPAVLSRHTLVPTAPGRAVQPKSTRP
jgi:hypothetical protein